MPPADETHGTDHPGPAHPERIERLSAWSPLYANLLKQNPALADWLESAEGAPDRAYTRRDFQSAWASDFSSGTTPAEPAALAKVLRRFRRRMSLRIAYRDLNGLSTVPESLSELSLLAEFCLETLLRSCQGYWENKMGLPWDEEGERPARLCVLALGKFGGGELNFCSDIDLIFFFDGEGRCRKNGQETGRTNQECFVRVCQELTARLQERDEHGFLYNADLRLRPQGDSGPLVPSLQGLENYYYVSGQVWERLALIKARAVAGDLGLGDELFERINPFRYPRHPPPFLLEGIAGVKIRIEKEVVGQNALRDHLKSGYGGIREIEFFVQALQMINGGKNPFVHTPNTLSAIDQLERYQLLGNEQASFLRRSYLSLRRLENQLQMRREQQTHVLPPDSDKKAWELWARIWGHGEPGNLRAWLDELREGVRRNYEELFKESDTERQIQDWTLLLTGQNASEAIHQSLERWFGGEATGKAPDALRNFVLGDRRGILSREQVTLFLNLSQSFDELLPELATPLETLEKVAQFGKAYGAPRQFFKTCADNPRMFRSLTLLFDRSDFVFQLLRHRPEIIEEVLGPRFETDKSVAEHLNEIALLPQSDEAFPGWLWLYVKAEQVRLTVRDLLSGAAGRERCRGQELGRLADAAVIASLRHLGLEDRLCVVALGKFGSGELTFGSDLDLIVLGETATDPGLTRHVTQWTKLLGHGGPLGRTYEVDLRLRPHGQDGPLIVTPHSLRAYFSGGGARFWERMAQTRSRLVTGPAPLREAFESFREERIFNAPVSEEDLAEIGRMRQRIETEKGKVTPPERAFKAGRGGLVDLEFLAQRYQLTHGAQHSELRHGTTRELLERLGELEILPREAVADLSGCHRFLRDVEHTLRRYRNTSASVLDPALYGRLAVWLGEPDAGAFAERLRAVMDTTRRLVRQWIEVPEFPD